MINNSFNRPKISNNSLMIFGCKIFPLWCGKTILLDFFVDSMTALFKETSFCLSTTKPFCSSNASASLAVSLGRLSPKCYLDRR